MNMEESEFIDEMLMQFCLRDNVYSDGRPYQSSNDVSLGPLQDRFRMHLVHYIIFAGSRRYSDEHEFEFHNLPSIWKKLLLKMRARLAIIVANPPTDQSSLQSQIYEAANQIIANHNTHHRKNNWQVDLNDVLKHP